MTERKKDRKQPSHTEKKRSMKIVTGCCPSIDEGKKRKEEGKTPSITKKERNERKQL
jgi:hypothetical protein